MYRTVNTFRLSLIRFKYAICSDLNTLLSVIGDVSVLVSMKRPIESWNQSVQVHFSFCTNSNTDMIMVAELDTAVMNLATLYRFCWILVMPSS